ncbi:short-chain dehydrogenase/reductase SDR [Beutenbergia cavernae DSM 12333]|uniref:Short-chain dehydrogenase/reductase SDR n=1 Tax=Beutenbergia cavernae (strain ATCC BAA-8 / DSM 12333 / CCUG 43141 / JCM 11478 / NBRC 16432 / NCIMB 13614 / HKI 0122) TaxID=471853 RepID=C5C3I0_BEUC1|nr:SDR family NAD(P)-dependent oxidoreductase [Beutenbergia cavernae]ACQ81889.1 short-chain dehydrogenase/reductase SDR [Beutenbergia cavernae DSM 12333]
MGRALITGASAGLGLEFAWQLAAGGHDLVLVARDAERLEHHAAQLRAAGGVDVEVLPADLADRAQVERVAERLRDDVAPVGLLVNNAGFGLRQRFVGGDLAAEERALDVMVRAVLVLSHAAAGAMADRGRGAICNVASVAALTASGTYAAHKAWVRTFTETLAAQLAGSGVTATALCPGYTHTEFHERAGLRMSWLPEVGFLDAERVVAAGLRDVSRGVVISTPSLRYKAASAALRVLPRSLVRRIDHRRPPRGA